MFGIYVSECGCIHYAAAIAGGYKTIETRFRNMLKSLVGERVAIIRTRKGLKPMVIGYATITDSFFCAAADFDSYRNETLIPPRSAYDNHGRGKWMYRMAKAERCAPYELPENKINHGRSYCEF